MIGKWLRRRSRSRSDQPQIHRRDLLQGKFWKLMRPSHYIAPVVRYPKSAQDLQAQDLGAPDQDTPDLNAQDLDGNRADRSAASPKTIQGIAIEPVAPTSLASRSRAPTIPMFRPPGAISEAQFLAGCTRCNECAQACPHHAIRPAPERLGPLAGTPTIEPDLAACMMCEDFPCIQACEPGVLSDAASKVMGTARITEPLCLAHQGTTCTVCSERCPVEGAIVVTRGRPSVDETTCTGCGVCRFVCPAPENAILLMPAFLRPLPPTT